MVHLKLVPKNLLLRRREISRFKSTKDKIEEEWTTIPFERKENTEDNHDVGQNYDHDDPSFRVRSERNIVKEEEGISHMER